MSKTDYPTEYNGKQGECQYDEGKVAFKNTGMVQERYVSNERLRTIVAQQPVSAGIVVTSGFKNYKHGVMTEDFLDCSDGNKQINHAVTIVGYGKSEEKSVQNSWCKGYWIVRNSWGASWGEQGFFKLCMDKAGDSSIPYGTCHINRFPSYPQ